MKYARQGGRRVHVESEHDDKRARCGADLWGDEYPARLVPVDERCQATGCRQAWPAQLRLVS